MEGQFVSIDRIFAKLAYITTNLDENDAIEWIGEALEFIGTRRIYEEAISFFEVKDYQCQMPAFTHQIIQIAKNNNWRPDNLCVTPKCVIDEVPNIMYQTCSSCMPGTEDMGYVVLDGKGTPVVEYDIAYYRPYFDLLGEYYGWSNSNYYNQNYSPVRLSTSSFFGSVLDKNCKDEYTIISNNILRFSFSCGSVAIAHKRQPVDVETGYPMIPDNISHITACTAYIKMKLNDRDLFNKREGSIQLSQKLEADWQWYCGQASNSDKMIRGIDEHQNLLDQRSNMLPNYSKYFSYFGSLNMPEYRKFNDPDGRNHGARFVTGHN